LRVNKHGFQAAEELVQGGFPRPILARSTQVTPALYFKVIADVKWAPVRALSLPTPVGHDNWYYFLFAIGR
jgi:hypothetical protein